MLRADLRLSLQSPSLAGLGEARREGSGVGSCGKGRSMSLLSLKPFPQPQLSLPDF